ncbi:hypothetical protein FJ930_06525 [Mesorhizobium sp. B2-4-15]|nr:hypothetical protein FJ930_06525 [Mesorhizobium sp. B2-4-15]
MSGSKPAKEGNCDAPIGRRDSTPLCPAGHLPRKGGDWQLRRPHYLHLRRDLVVVTSRTRSSSGSPRRRP